MIEISSFSKSGELLPSNSEPAKPLDALDRRVKVVAEESIKIHEASPYAHYTIVELFEVIEKLEEDPGAAAEVEQSFRELARRPPSLETIELLVKRRGKPISKAERQLMNALKKQLPDLNRALASYELLQRETDRMDLSRFTPRELQIGNETFAAYDTAGAEYRFLVHAAGLDEGPIEKVKKRRMKSGFLCGSLISNEIPRFYKPQANYAMVLSVDPRNIVATTREDAFTPYSSVDSNTLKFYRFYQRLQLLTGYVDLLYRESGAGQDHASDQFSRLNRLLALKHDSLLSPELEQAVDQLKALNHISQDDAVLDRYQKIGASLIKLREAIRHLESNPNPRALSDCRRCEALLVEILEENIRYRHIHPILSAEELLAQTPFQRSTLYNNFGESPYNEVNFDLATHYSPLRDPVEVRAVMIHSAAFQQNPEDFQEVLKNAKERGIPILIGGDPPSTPDRMRAKFLRAAEDKKYDLIMALMQSEAIDGAFAGEVLLKIVEKSGSLHLIDLILTQKQDIPEEMILKAFNRALELGLDLHAKTIYLNRRGILQERALELLNAESVNWKNQAISAFIRSGVQLTPAKAGEALLGFLKAYDSNAVKAILSRYLNVLPKNDLEVFFKGLNTRDPIFRDICLTLEAAKLFSQQKQPGNDD